MAKTIRCLIMVLIGFGLSGCAHYYNIKVNAYTEPAASEQMRPGSSFFVMANEDAKNPLLDAEIKGKIVKLLETRGYPITTYDKADYYLFFGYGMGEPRSVGVAAPDYYGSFGWGWGGGYGWGGWGGWGGPSVSVGIPWGYSADTATRYDRWLLITVVDGPAYRTQKLSRPVWVGEARSTGASSDLRTVLNYLLVAEFKEFGKNTGKAISIDLKEHDPAVSSLTH